MISFSLSDLNEHRGDYASIFDNPYSLRSFDAHDRYGSKVHINAFMETDDGA